MAIASNTASEGKDMAFTRVSKDAGVIAALPDRPNSGVGGLSPAQLKAKFDELGAALKTYLNDTLCAIPSTALWPALCRALWKRW